MDQPRHPPISVVVPIRDEEGTLGELHRRLRDALPGDAEIILVDDGSRDGTHDLLRRIVAADAGTVALRLARPFGKSYALAVGFSRCRGDIVATIDADLQEDPADIMRLVGRMGDNDLLTGWRRRRRDRPLKVLASRLFNALVRVLSGVPLRDINCGLKVMRREVVESIRLEAGYHRFIPLLAHWRGFRVGEVEVDHEQRRHGSSRFGKERIFHGLVDLVVLLFLERFERRPSRFFVGSGSMLSFAGFAICLYLTLLKWITGTIQSRYPLLILGVLLLVVGLQVVSAGFLAELVARRRRDGPDERIRVFEIAGEGEGEGVGDEENAKERALNHSATEDTEDAQRGTLGLR